MKEIQNVVHERKLMRRLRYATAYWNTLSDRQQELIFEQSGWN